jgi:hypothetical protein
MNDLQTLQDTWGTPDAPSHTASTRARAALLARAAESRRPEPAWRRFPLSRLGARVAAVSAVALTIATLVTVAGDLGRTGADGGPTSIVPGLPGVPVASAAVLERAAVAAETKPFTAPRDDQWIYVEDRFITSHGGGGETETQRTWRRADGGGLAWIDEHGKLQVRTLEPPKARPGRPSPPLEDYKALAALPTDPDALLRWAYALAEHTTGGGMDDDGDVYLIFNHILRGNLLPPDLEAAIFRALKQVPGVTVVDTVDVSGRPALALGLRTSDWLHEELLLDTETYAYRGERSTVVRDATIDPLKAGNPTGEVRKGSKVVVARMVTAIVDQPGQRG